MEVIGQRHDPAALPIGKEPLVPIVQEAWWAPEPFWTRWWREIPSPRRESNPRTPIVQPVAHYFKISHVSLLRNFFLFCVENVSQVILYNDDSQCSIIKQQNNNLRNICSESFPNNVVLCGPWKTSAPVPAAAAIRNLGQDVLILLRMLHHKENWASEFSAPMGFSFTYKETKQSLRTIVLLQKNLHVM
jgi:hypothetical protein